MFTEAKVIGRLTRDPELKTVGDNSVVNFSVAANRQFNKDKVDFFDVTAWRKLGEKVAAYKNKGDLVMVSGSLETQSWEQDGQKRTKVIINARDVVFLPSKNDDKNGNTGVDNSGPSNADQDIPF